MADEVSEVVAVEGLERLQYWLLTTRDNFDVSQFRGALPAAFRESEATSVLIEAVDESFPCYALFSWSIYDDDVELSIDYHGANAAAQPVDQEDSDRAELSNGGEQDEVDTLPCPEHLMSWLGQFFGSNGTSSHAHARYRYAGDKKQLTFDLALASAPPAHAELYGVALRLRSTPDGITSVRLTRGLSDWYVEITYDREITFADFDPLDDAASLLPTLNAFLTEKRE